MIFKIEISQFYDENVKPNNVNKTKSDTFPWDKLKSDTKSFFIKKCFNDFQNRNFSVLWLKWTQTMEMKQNQTFFHGTCSHLTPYLSLSKIIDIFQYHSKSKFLSFMTKVDPNNRSKIRHFSVGHIKRTLKYFNGFYNCNFSISL